MDINATDKVTVELIANPALEPWEGKTFRIPMRPPLDGEASQDTIWGEGTVLVEYDFIPNALRVRAKVEAPGRFMDGWKQGFCVQRNGAGMPCYTEMMKRWIYSLVEAIPKATISDTDRGITQQALCAACGI